MLETQRCILRSITDNDLERIYSGLSHPDVIRYYGVSYDSLEATQTQMAWFKGLENNLTGKWWTLWSKDQQHFYGAAGLNDVDSTHKKGEVGFWLLPDYWGKELLKEVLPVVCQYGFETFGLNRIEGFVDNQNTKCKKALAKLNFNYEGTMINCEIKDGEFISIDIYALFQPDSNM